MTQEDKIREIFRDSEGIVRAGNLRQKGVHSVYLTRLYKAGKVYEWLEDGAKTDVEVNRSRWRVKITYPLVGSSPLASGSTSVRTE